MRSGAAWRRRRFGWIARHHRPQAQTQLTGLPAFSPGPAARRLHIAAGLIDRGFLTPAHLLVVCELDRDEIEKVAKAYDPNEPRIDARNPGAGEWTRDGSAAGAPHPRNGNSGRSALRLDDDCDAEWADAIRICKELLNAPNPPRSLTGCYKTPRACAKGFVSQRCGGNRV